MSQNINADVSDGDPRPTALSTRTGRLPLVVSLHFFRHPKSARWERRCVKDRDAYPVAHDVYRFEDHLCGR